MKYKNGKRITRLKSFPKNVQIHIIISGISQIDKIKVQSNRSYVTFKGNNEIWSHKTGGHLIQV